MGKKDCPDTPHKTSIGGQAVIEGVMMKGPENICVAVRKAGGEIITDRKQINPMIKKHKLFKLPIIRGIVAFVDSLVLGTKTLMYSAEQYEIEEEDAKDAKPSKFDAWIEKVFGNKEAVIYTSVVLAMLLAAGLFIWLPANIVGLLRNAISNRFLLSLIEGVVRISIFVLYIFLVSRSRDIQRVFQYHGAEHKSIYCYENGEALTVENVKKYPCEHPRCGTSFLLEVMVISVIVFSALKWDNLLLRVVLKLLLMPLVAGLAYEFLKVAGKSTHPIMRFLNKPGMWLQNLTTREPDESQIEVAICALNGVLTGNKEDDKW